MLVELRLITGLEVEWVEGWVLPSEPGYPAPEAASETEVDHPAWGRLGLSGGVVCEIAQPCPDRRGTCGVAVAGEHGQVWFGGHDPVIVQGRGAVSTPVFPGFLEQPLPETWPDASRGPGERPRRIARRATPEDTQTQRIRTR